MSNMGLVERHVQPVTNAASPNDSTSINGWTLPTSPAGNIPPRPPQPSTTSLGRSEFTNANTNDGWNASAASRSLAEASSSPVTQFAQPSSTGAPTGGIGWDDDEPMASISPAARPDQGGIGWGDPVPAPASSSSSNGTQAQQRNNGESYGSALDDARSVQPSDSISNVDGSDRSTSTVNGKGNGRGVQYHTDTNGYGSSNADYHGHRERSQGSYNDHLSTHQNSYNQPNGSYSYGPPVERRFPGAGGSWASGPNEIPLRQNRWQTQGGRRPGDDVRRPAVPQAIPGSGW